MTRKLAIFLTCVLFALDSGAVFDIGDKIREKIINETKRRPQQELKRLVSRLEREVEQGAYHAIEDHAHIPIGRLLDPSTRLIPSRDPRYSEFDPIFLTFDWEGPTNDDLKGVLHPVYEVLWEAFNKKSIPEEILISKSDMPNPYISIEYRKNLALAFESGYLPMAHIRIVASGYDYQNYTYQFAHELGHLLMNFEKPGLRWVDETFADLASAYVLAQFYLRPPYTAYSNGDWQRYFDIVYTQKDAVLEQYHDIGPNEKAKSWMTTEKMDVLIRTGYNRELNWGVARELLPHFIADPTLWKEVSYLNVWYETTADIYDTQDFLNGWERTLRSNREQTRVPELLKSILPHAARER